MNELLRFIKTRPIIMSKQEKQINYIAYPTPEFYNLSAIYVNKYQELSSKTLFAKLQPLKGDPDFWAKAKTIINNLPPDDINRNEFIKAGLFLGIDKAINYATHRQNLSVQTLVKEIDDKIWFGNKDSKKIPYTIERRREDLYTYFILLWDMLIYETIVEKNTTLKSEIMDCIRIFHLYFTQYSTNKVSNEFRKEILLPNIFDLYNPDFLPEAVGGKTPYEEPFKNRNNECTNLDRNKCYEYENRPTPRSKGFIKAIGWGDLKVIKKELIGFQTGEIATIVNVMKNESLDDTLRHLVRQEEVKFDEKETEKEETKELETNNRFELDKEVSKIQKEDASMEAGITASAKYGTELAGGSVTGHLDISTSTSKEQSDKEAHKMAQEITSRATSRIKERIKSSTTKTTLVETERTKRHGFLASLDHNIGVYYFIDKVYRSRVFNYGQRLLLDFMIPRPAAYYIYQRKKVNQISKNLIKPIHPSEFKIKAEQIFIKNVLYRKDGYIVRLDENRIKKTSALYLSLISEGCTYFDEYDQDYITNGVNSFTDINEFNYIELCSHFGVSDVNFPIFFKKSFTAIGNTNAGSFPDAKIIVEEGYGLRRIYGRATVVGGGLSLFIGQNQVWVTDSAEYNYPNVGSTDETNDDLSIIGMSGNIPFVVNANIDTPGGDPFSVSVIVDSTLSELGYRQWQIDTYNKIIQAYEQKLLEYERKVEQQNLGKVEYGNNPNINRIIEAEELKKACISLMTNQKFESFDAMQDGMGPNKYPEFNNLEAWREGKYVDFFDKVLEYDQMMYRFSDYYWQDKDKWIETNSLEENDPLFVKFLRAGYARVTLAVRPGYEKELIYFLNTGKVWIGGSTPTIDSPLFVSIIDQIKESEDATGRDKPTGEPWEVIMPTNMVILGVKDADATCMDSDNHPDLPCFQVSRPFVIDKDGMYYKKVEPDMIEVQEPNLSTDDPEDFINVQKQVGFKGEQSSNPAENLYGANDIRVDFTHIKS